MNDEALVDAMLGVAWSQWRELGVPSVVRGSEHQVVDPERLISVTPALARFDARLDEQAFDWCAAHGDWVSARRLRAVASEAHPLFSSAFLPWAETLVPHTRSAWADGTHAGPDRRPRTSPRLDLRRPSLARLRSRALLGVGARADVVCDLLARSHQWIPAGDVASVGYSRRAVSAVLNDLERADVLICSQAGRSRLYRLRQPSDLASLLRAGDIRWPPWDSVFDVIGHLLDLRERALEGAVTLPVHVAKCVETVSPHAERLGWQAVPTDLRGLGEWATKHLSALLHSSDRGGVSHIDHLLEALRREVGERAVLHTQVVLGATTYDALVQRPSPHKDLVVEVTTWSRLEKASLTERLRDVLDKRATWRLTAHREARALLCVVADSAEQAIGRERMADALASLPVGMVPFDLAVEWFDPSALTRGEGWAFSSV
jgi:DNA-binding transcriptional ArsR family regulator